MCHKYILLLSFLWCFQSCQGLENGLGLTPQMGWNSWNAYHCDVSELKIRQAIDGIVDYDLARYGYVYVNIDDCWSQGRDKNGVLVPDQNTFPNGISALADYAHSYGLKLGIYSDSGTLTCAGRPGSYGYETIDAKTWASWGVDYLKYDNCWSNVTMGLKERYMTMRDALANADRPIFYSMCEWGVEAPWYWGSKVGNSWRTTGDISDDWNSMTYIISQTVGTSRFAGPGGWNDIDMLEVGNGGMSMQQYQIHFAFWCLLKAPLILGFDIYNKMTPEVYHLITNMELINVNQDPLGVQGDLIWQVGSAQIWAGPLADGSRAFIFFTRLYPVPITLDFSLVGYEANTTAVVRDILNKQDVGTFTGKFTANVAWQSVFVGRLTPTKITAKDKTWRPWHNNCFN
eukprot:TRINITY_DN410_c0_g1_i1.p1 TRINITY_DN410_c0_g1~~TRINITY_DN410_c0_g1_i1.p1  ORF type:complete len:401 (-),score=66.66 TRINITY_DN410_c0_g1_i1:96-1298(-)